MYFSHYNFESEASCQASSFAINRSNNLTRFSLPRSLSMPDRRLKHSIYIVHFIRLVSCHVPSSPSPFFHDSRSSVLSKHSSRQRNAEASPAPTKNFSFFGINIPSTGTTHHLEYTDPYYKELRNYQMTQVPIRNALTASLPLHTSRSSVHSSQLDYGLRAYGKHYTVSRVPECLDTPYSFDTAEV